jgi:hypothetical protein
MTALLRGGSGSAAAAAAAAAAAETIVCGIFFAEALTEWSTLACGRRILDWAGGRSSVSRPAGYSASIGPGKVRSARPLANSTSISTSAALPDERISSRQSSNVVGNNFDQVVVIVMANVLLTLWKTSLTRVHVPRVGGQRIESLQRKAGDAFRIFLARCIFICIGGRFHKSIRTSSVGEKKQSVFESCGSVDAVYFVCCVTKHSLRELSYHDSFIFVLHGWRLI